MTEETAPVRQHYYLVAGHVVVEKDEHVQALPQNAMLITDEQKLGVHQIGKAQQALQVSLFKKLGDTINVVDVLIIGITHLGHMTSEEFNARPDGVEVQERERPSAEVIDLFAPSKDGE